FIPMRASEIMRNPVAFAEEVFGVDFLRLKNGLIYHDSFEQVAVLDQWFVERYQKEQEGFLVEMAHMADIDQDWEEADQYYHRAIKQAYARDNQNELYLFLQNHSEVLTRLNRPQAAFDTLARAYALALAQKEADRQALTEEMQARFEVQQAEQRSAQQAAAFALRQRNTLLITSLIGLLLLLTGIFLLRNWRQNRLLREKQQAVERALAAREAIMREMHHRIKNNLQFVSSLLRLQARDLDDPEAQDALLHSRSRVLTMAMIHKHLYEEAEQPSIRMDTYLQKLMHEVEQSLSEPGKQIKVDLDISALELDIDQAVPVALIAHEAVVNAFKHGFSGRSEGRVVVRLQQQQAFAKLIVSDNGTGKSVGSSSGFGQRLIHLLTERLKGSLQLSQEEGYQLRLSFPFNAPLDVSA
ncbi:MAG: sensor histidine kinase, partial [Bacteroidota bacterium]